MCSNKAHDLLGHYYIEASIFTHQLPFTLIVGSPVQEYLFSATKQIMSVHRTPLFFGFNRSQS